MAAWWEAFTDFADDAYDYGKQAVSTAASYGGKAYDAVEGYGNQAYDVATDYGDRAYTAASDFGTSLTGGGGGGTAWDSGWNNGQSSLPAANQSWNQPVTAPAFSSDTGSSMGSGLQMGSGPSMGLNPNAQGSGLQFDTASNTPTTDGVTGGFGVTPTSAGQPQTRSMLSQAGGGNYNINSGGFQPAPRGPNMVEQQINKAQAYVRENPSATRMGLDAAGMFLGYRNNRDANKLAEQQMNMQRAGQTKNNAMADKLNAQASQSINEARSLYNPQEMAVRAMAQQQMNTARNMNDARTQMTKAGKSKATIDAEMRRAKLSGTTGATTAFVRGLDTGRAAQQSALSSAKGLSKDYNTTADYSGANAVAASGRADAENLTNMLNTYLGNPVYQQEVEAMRRAQQNAYYNS